jgi:TonB family protein
MMSLKPYACHPARRVAAASAAVALVWIAVSSPYASAARREDDAPTADPLTRAKRNIVAVVDWDKADGKALLGTGILLQRDKALIPCRIAAATRNLGVSQEQRRSQAQLSGERVARGLCELKIVHPVHFDPLPLEIRPIEEVVVGDSVYAVSTGSGRELSMVKARISGIGGAGENKVIRISRGLNPGSTGSALFDRSGALIGINALRQGKGEEAAFNYPMEYYLQVEEQKTQRAKVTTPPWEDTKPPAQLQVAAEPTTQPPKTARAQRPAERASAENLAYKQAVKDYLEDIVRASTKHVVYPDSARKSHWIGTTSIWFRLNSGGELSESFVDTSSGYATLDVAALLAVRKAINDLQAPQLIKDRGMMATVAVTFALADR